ncbi:hypothetical protein OESDEN_09510 [Oesophagostomum dentatum]|uniref:Uncharacterized protein n=1 Tax=Oesophagostomum dentatum TaxID=61180 RepID=A0A0B1T3F9_OESDE|nr:hypothetical protein OESDEN_09510 [Oesophagostomum dentatum]
MEEDTDTRVDTEEDTVEGAQTARSAWSQPNCRIRHGITDAEGRNQRDHTIKDLHSLGVNAEQLAGMTAKLLAVTISHQWQNAPTLAEDRIAACFKKNPNPRRYIRYAITVVTLVKCVKRGSKSFIQRACAKIML